MKNCIIFLSHVINDNIAERFLKLKQETQNNYDVYFIFDSSSTDYEITKQYSNKIDFVYINQNDLDELGYKRFIDGSVLGVEYWYVSYFSKILNYNYDNYWVMEYDVMFNGNYNDFFSDIDNNIHQDFITQKICNKDEERYWHWWEENYTLPRRHHKRLNWYLLKSFNPIYRISIKCIDFLDTFLKENKITGYFEYFLITILYNNNFSIFSINNDNDKSYYFTNDEYNKKYSNNETFRFKPNIEMSDIEKHGENLLYHPLK